MRYLKNFILQAYLLIFVWAATALAHDVYLPVIVDTDGAADDIRAMAMLLNAGSADIRLIVTSDGALSPRQARQSVRKLLACLDRTGIPVIAGSELSADPPVFRKLNESLNWPERARDTAGKDATGATAAPAAVISVVQQAENDLLYLCLGPMTNLAAALKEEPMLKDRIERVIYLGSSPGSDEPGWNTSRDPESAQTVYSSGLPVYGLGLPDERYLPFDEALYAQIRDADSEAARLLSQIHDFPAMKRKIKEGHTRVWDEMAVIYANLMAAFEFEPIAENPATSRLRSYDAAAVKDAYLRLLGHPADFHLDARHSVVLKQFPMQAELMRTDVAPFMKKIINRHGAEEWKACLLTNELHRHLGIYSLVGAKMGIRAREILEAPFDSLNVISYAGSAPPLSCLNDGLQVSTGASLGRGAIKVVEGGKKPAAAFIKGTVRLTLTLKPEYVARVKADVAAAIDRFGGLGPAYFDHIRTLSIRYWQEFDRHQLFAEEFSRQGF